MLAVGDNHHNQYELEKSVALSGNIAARLDLARNGKTQPEILYYLAQHDDEATIRAAVATNEATPFQANPIIAADRDVDVRLALTERLLNLLPDLPDDKQSQLYHFTIDALETLASDEVTKIRIVLANTLKKELRAPPHIVTKLAQDIERKVAEPILHHCLAVSDEVLLEILSNHPASWTVEAIAKRRFVSASVSAAVIETENEKAGGYLLRNDNAEIPEKTLFKIAEQSKKFFSWQKPLAIRAFLPPEIARKMANFVDDSVKSLLSRRSDIDGVLPDEIRDRFRRELNELEQEDLKRMSPEDRVRKLIVDDALNEETLIGALDNNERVFSIVTLAALARTSRATMENVIGMMKAKPLIAVCYRAGISMRSCIRIQQEIACLPPRDIIYARGGTDYPLDNEEIKWQLDYLGLN